MHGVDLIVAKVLSEPWAILPRRGQAILGVLARRFAGRVLSAAEVEAAVGAEAAARDARVVATATGGSPSGVAVFPVYGAIVNRAYEVERVSSGGLTSAERLGAALRRADADPAVSAIVLDIDSPGGSVGGMPELFETVASLGKPVVAQANTLAASAAYWLATAADEIVVTPSGEVGSIGVYTLHEDWSRALEAEGVTVTPIYAGARKVEGNSFAPLSDEARANIQSYVDDFHGMFVADVARGRGVSKSRVRSDFGQGRTMLAAEAKAAGLVDRIATLDETLSRLTNGSKPRKRARAEVADEAPRMTAEQRSARAALYLLAGREAPKHGPTLPPATHPAKP